MLFFGQNEFNAVSIMSTEPHTINYATLSAKKANKYKKIPEFLEHFKKFPEINIVFEIEKTRDKTARVINFSNLNSSCYY